ncbi:MAG: 50S ribosomal protein L25 [Acidimicrobiia bacterium]
MADVVLQTEPRKALGSRNAGRIRREGLLPAVVYGLQADSVAVTVSARELNHALHSESGANTLITLKIEGEEDALALARQIQRHPTRNELVHVDFVRVRRDVAVTAEIPLVIEGEPPGTKEGGILEQLFFSVTVEALPGNIPTSIVVDVSHLALGDQLHIADLPIPAGVSVQHEPDELVAQVSIPRGLTEEEEAGEAAEGEEGAVEGEEGAAEASASEGGSEDSEGS